MVGGQTGDYTEYRKNSFSVGRGVNYKIKLFNKAKVFDKVCIVQKFEGMFIMVNNYVNISLRHKPKTCLPTKVHEHYFSTIVECCSDITN